MAAAISQMDDDGVDEGKVSTISELFLKRASITYGPIIINQLLVWLLKLMIAFSYV